MPIYEYECKNCLKQFEIIRRRFDGNGSSPCPYCGSQARRLFSPVAVVFKGPGFYVTDYRKNSNHGADESKDLQEASKVGKSGPNEKGSK